MFEKIIYIDNNTAHVKIAGDLTSNIMNLHVVLKINLEKF